MTQLTLFGRRPPVTASRALRNPRRWGPHPLCPDGVSVLVPDIHGILARFSAEDYSLAMSYRFRAATDGYLFALVRRKVGDRWRTDRVVLHRIIARAEPGELVHHKRGNLRDLRRSQLIRATHSQNTGGFRRLLPSKSSRYRGVTRHRSGKWQAALKTGERNHYLGLFHTEWLAAQAYNRKAREIFGKFAHLNRAGVDLRRCA